MAGFQYDLGSGAVEPGAAPQASAVQAQVSQGRVVGGFVSPVADTPIPGPTNADRTLDAILEIGKGVLAGKIKEQQNKAFLGGVQRVMQGEALKDIVDEQPWYTEIFGPSSTVEGARAYSQISQVDKFTGDLYGDMDRLQRIDPDKVGDEVNTKMSQFLTGDDVTDTAIQMKMVESVGPFFKAHAKQHYKWQQTEMQTQVTNAMLQSGSTIQAAAKSWVDGTSTPEDRNQALAGAISSWQPLQGQSAKSYWEAVKTATITSMAQGNHYMAQAVWADHDGKGSLFDAAPADVKLDLLNARETYENRTRQKEGTLEFGAEMGRIQGLMATHQVTPQKGLEMMEAVNTKFRLKTGIDGDMYDKNDVAKYIQADYVAYYKAAEAARKENATGQKESQKLIEQTNSSLTAFMLGNAQGAIDSGIPRQVVDNTALAAMRSQAEAGNDPMETLVRNYTGAGSGGSGYVNNAVKNNMMSGIYASTAGYTPLLDQSVQYFDKMKAVPNGGDAAVLAYFGTENATKINNYKQYLGSGLAPEVAWQASFGQPLNKITTTPKEKLTKKLLSSVEGDQPGLIAELFGGETALTKNNIGVLATATQRHFDVLRSQIGVGEEQALSQAVSLAKQEIDIVGPYAYQKKEVDQKPVAALIGADPTAAGKVVADFFAQKASKQGFKLPAGSAIPEAPKTEYKNLFGGTSRGAAPWNSVPGTANFWEQWGKDTTDSVTMLRGADRVDNDGKVHATFVLMGVTDDGKPVQMGATSDELREFYEQQPYFHK